MYPPNNLTEGDVNRTASRDSWQAEHLGEASRLLLARDAEVFLHQSLSTPCLNTIAHSEGSWITDIEGRRYLDFHGNSVHQIGHAHPRVIEAVCAQLQSLSFAPRRYTNEVAVELAERLVSEAPTGLRKVLFTPSGTGAVGLALKMARLATGRHKTISMWDSFHGASLDAISVGGESIFRSGIGPLLPGTEHVSPPDPIRCPFGCGNQCSLLCANYLEYVLAKEGDVAAVIAEPIRATTAVLPPPDYWKRIRAACDRHGALLIFDEIPTGLGRAGALFASELSGVSPDILVMGKGLGGGVFPMAAVLATAKLDVGGHIALGHYTHEKSPVGAAAGLATLNVIREEQLIERSATLGQSFLSALRNEFGSNSRVREIRGAGLLIGVELHEASHAERAMYTALAHGLSFKVSAGTVLTLTPPLTVTESELELALAALRAALNQ